MIAWAREQTLPRSARPVLHFGALLATFPFVGAVARVIGQHLQTEGSVEASVVRAEVRRSLGDRSSVDVATRKTYTTLCNLELLQHQRPLLLAPTEPPQVPDALDSWMGHALLLTRNADSMPLTSLRGAPEFLGAVQGGSSSPKLGAQYELVLRDRAASGSYLHRRA